MDKYEFNIKAEQMRKRIDEGDFQTAMQIADTIDWRRVRNANLLASVADIYEQNEEYEEARDILLLARERASASKRFLYKLAVVSVKAGNLGDAGEYYKEFCDAAPDDPLQYVLRYMILKAKGAGPEQLIRALEDYTSTDLDEHWLYELASLYARAGREEECVQTCDKIMLLFGLGQYVDRAMELKLKFRPLSRQQMDLVENREKYEANLRRISREYGSGEMASEPDDFGINWPEDEPGTPEAAEENADAPAQAAEAGTDFHPAEPYGGESGETAAETFSGETGETAEESFGGETGEVREVPEEETAAGIALAAAAAKPGTEEPEVSLGEEAAASTEMSNTEQAAPVPAAPPVPEIRKPVDEALDGARKTAGAVITPLMKERSDEQGPKPSPYHMIIEAKTPADGMQIAIDEIKYYHELYGLHYKVARTDAGKLNEKGFSGFIPRLADKDLIVDHAGSLSQMVLEEMAAFIDGKTDATSLVLVDVIDSFDRMAAENPEFVRRFDIVSEAEEVPEEPAEEEDSLFEDVDLNSAPAAADETKPSGQPEKTAPERAAVRETTDLGRRAERQLNGEAPAALSVRAQSALFGKAAAPEADVREMEDAIPKQRPLETADAGTAAEAEEEAFEDEEAYDAQEAYERDVHDEELPADYYDSMSVDDFATYAQEYARSIDCAMPGKTVLALYERIEQMEEEGIALTKQTAEDLIEEAADSAESPGISKKLTGMFHPKYDKDDKLILREENFIH